MKHTVVGKPPPAEAHSPLGPSAAKRWMNCPGSVALTKDMPNTSSQFAAEGSAAHTLSEWVREQGKKARYFQGKKIEHEGYTFEVNGEMVTAVQKFVDYCELLPGDPFYEIKVHYDGWVPNGWGTADDIRIDEETGWAHVTDLKYGKGVQVFIADDPQLRMYSLGVFQEYGHLYDIKGFKMAIHQPRLSHIDEKEISVKDLLVWARDEVRPAAELALSDNAPLKAGPWCQFCPARDVCEARAKAVQEEYLSDLETDVETIPNYRLAEILDTLPEIKAWVKDIEARGLSQLQQGNPVGEYKLVAGRSVRVWKSDADAEKALRGAKLKVGEIFVKRMVSPAQAEKLLGKDHPVLVEQIHKPPGRPVMVPGSDPRPPLQVSAEDEFEDLDKE